MRIGTPYFSLKTGWFFGPPFCKGLVVTKFVSMEKIYGKGRGNAYTKYVQGRHSHGMDKAWVCYGKVMDKA